MSTGYPRIEVKMILLMYLSAVRYSVSRQLPTLARCARASSRSLLLLPAVEVAIWREPERESTRLGSQDERESGREGRDSRFVTFELLSDVGHLLVDAFLLELPHSARPQVGDVLLVAIRDRSSVRSVRTTSFRYDTRGRGLTVKPLMSSLTMISEGGIPRHSAWKRS